jgi:exonuclease III
MTWNANGLLSGGRELALAYLLQNNNVDVMVVTKTKIPDKSAPFASTGYVTFFPLVRAKEKTHTVMLVRASIATQAGVQVRPDLMKIATCQTVWVTLSAHTRLGQITWRRHHRRNIQVDVVYGKPSHSG